MFKNYRRNSDESLRDLERQILLGDTSSIESYIHGLARSGRISIYNQEHLNEMLVMTKWLVDNNLLNKVIDYCSLNVIQQDYVRRIFRDPRKTNTSFMTNYQPGDPIQVKALRRWIPATIRSYGLSPNWFYVDFDIDENVPDTVSAHWDTERILPIDPLGILI